MKPSKTHIPVESNSPLRGLATTPPSTRLSTPFSPNLLNCIVRDGIVTRRSGYQQIGQQLVGRVLAITEFGELGQDPNLVVLTSHRQYYYDVGTNTFIDLTPGLTSYTITDNVDGNSVQIAGDHVADFPAGRLVPIVGGSNAGVYTVDSAVLDTGNTVVTFVEPLPDVLIVDGDLVIADDFTTGTRDLIDYVAVTDVNGRRMIITNGVDTPRTWNGDTGTPFADWAPTFTDFVTCKTLCVFNEHLFLGNITTASNEEQLIAWSDAGDFDEFEAGQAGAQLLYTMSKGIVALKVLGDRLAIYSHDAVMTGVYVGGTAIFAFEVVIPEGTRLVCQNGIVSINLGHIYLSEENIYLFDGTRGNRVLGDQIYSDYKLYKDQANLHECCLLNDYSKRIIYISVPDITGGSNVYTVVYDIFDLGNLDWSKQKFVDQPRAFGFFTNHSVELTWDDASWETPSNPWSAESGRWSEESEQLEFPIPCFGTDDGKVFLLSNSVYADNGTVETQTYDTMDFTVPEIFHSLHGRWLEVEFEASGDDVDVSYSGDLGASFTAADSVELTTSYQWHRVPIDTTSRTIRIRFSSDTQFSLRWVRVWVRGGGPR